MSTLERREVTTTRVVRTLSPQRATSHQNISEFDNNLDHLLEDLQSSVSRPGSSLGNAYQERTVTYGSGKGDSLGRVQYLQAANPTHVIGDDIYNYKPAENTRSMKTYKTENYSTYNVNSEVPENVRMQNNINKLDTLLDDLQQVRQGTLDKDGSHREVKKTVHRELVYDEDKMMERRQEREGSVTREIQYINDGTYGDIRPIRQPSPSRSTLSKQVREYNYSTDATGAPSTEIVSVEPAINPNILAQLDPTLLPSPNTKVTTTIKTYTYEIPGAGYPTAVSPKLNETVFSSNPSTPSRSFAYNKVENVSTQNVSTTGYPGDYIRPVSPPPIGFNKKYVETTTTRNVTDGYGKPSPTPVRPGKDTYIYNETIKNVNNTDYPPGYSTSPPGKHVNVYKETTTTHNPDYPSGYPTSPPGKQINVYKETTTTKNINNPPHGNYPNNGYPNNNYPTGPGPVNKTYIINETHTTRNINNSPYPNGYPNNPDPQTTIVYKHDTHNNYPPKHATETFDPKSGPPNGYPKPHDPREPVNITYKYTTHHTTSNNYKGHPNDENEPLLHPPPFPTDGTDVDGKGPPKRLDDLMAEFGNEPPNSAYNAGYNQRQAELSQKKEIAHLSQDTTQKKDLKDMPKSKNVAGPPVYYPPNHELFAHKEESGGYRAEGGMMKESGKYKYEAKSSSKTKSSSGMAVVPVCLPLCCGLPCAIL